eukprot:SAG11_NODE_1478_length_4837_cov_1.608485_2_plen_139_part_00
MWPIVPLDPRQGKGTKLFTTVPEIVHARECTRYVIRRGIVPALAERGKKLLVSLLSLPQYAGSPYVEVLGVCMTSYACCDRQAEALVNLAKQPNANGTVIVVALLEMCSLVVTLGDSVDDLMHNAVDVVTTSVGRVSG